MVAAVAKETAYRRATRRACSVSRSVALSLVMSIGSLRRTGPPWPGVFRVSGGIANLATQTPILRRQRRRGRVAPGNAVGELAALERTRCIISKTDLEEPVFTLDDFLMVAH